MPLTDVRKPSGNPLKEAYQYYEGEEVEIFSQEDTGEPMGWWLGKIYQRRGGFFVVQFKGLDEAYKEIRPLEQIRPIGYWYVFMSSSIIVWFLLFCFWLIHYIWFQSFLLMV